MAGPLRPTPLSPFELNGRWNLERWKKRFQKKFFFLNGPALYSPPPLNGPAIKRRTFFAASLTKPSNAGKESFFGKILLSDLGIFD